VAIPVVVAERDAHRLVRGFRVSRRTNPDETVLFAHRVRRDTPPRVQRPTQARDLDTATAAVEPPAVVPALEVSVARHATERERHVAVRATIEQRTRAPFAVSKEDERYTEHGDRERMSRAGSVELLHGARHVPMP
jgi:hypothetical protein